METKREKNIRLFLNISGGLIGIRQLVDHFKSRHLLFYEESVEIEKALKSSEHIDEIGIEEVYSIINTAAEAQKELLNNYIDYLEDKVREE